MNKITAKVFGWEHPILSQVARIREGLLANNVELTDNEPDILYKNEDFFSEAIEFARICKKKPYTIFNILDLQIDNKYYNLPLLKEQLTFADRVTCISEFVKDEIKEYLNISAINIGNPIKDITYNSDIIKDIDFLIAGRNSDLNKRGSLFVEVINLPENRHKKSIAVGPEPLPYGPCNWVGIVNDSELNEIYNRSKFVICCSKREGLNLVIGESAQASIPLIANDMTVANEWNMPEFLVEPNTSSINDKIKEISKDYDKYLRISLNYGKFWKEKLNKNQIARNLLNIYEESKI